MTKGQPRKKAKERGEKFYHGKPCPICECTERRVDSGACRYNEAHRWAAKTPEEKRAHYEATREAAREYRKKRKPQNAAYQRKYRARHREKMREYMKLYMRDYRRRQANGS